MSTRGTTAERNPFRTERLHAIAPQLDEPLSTVLARFAAQGRRGVLVGPHGSGKTTLLEALAAQLGEVTWLRLRHDRAHNRRALAALPRTIGGVLVLDGLEQLGPLAWWRIRRRAPAILATSHQSGRLPTLRQHRSSPTLLCALVTALGEPPPADADELVARHDGNLRDCLRELYDRLASCPANEPLRQGPSGASGIT